MENNIKDYLHLYNDLKIVHEKYPDKQMTVHNWNKWGQVVMGRSDEFEDLKPHHKLVLRPLSDMTEGEKIMLCCMNLNPPWQPGHIIETNDDDIAAMRVFDMQGDYKTLYIPKKRIEPKNFLWLLKQGFDLFGLIESGLAIAKTSLNQGEGSQRSVATKDQSR